MAASFLGYRTNTASRNVGRGVEEKSSPIPHHPVTEFRLPSRSGLGVEHVAQTVAAEVEGEDSQQQGDSRTERVHRHRGLVDRALADHLTPSRGRRDDAQTDETQAGHQTNGSRSPETAEDQ